MRLFVSVPCPAAVAAGLRAALDPWLAALPAARWSPPDQYHITLKFLGETTRFSDAEKAAAKALAGLGAFTVAAGGLGVFPSAKRARVLWLDIKEGVPALAAAAARLDGAMSAAGFPADTRAYSPHLTLARMKETPLPTLAPPPEITWTADRVCLMESRLGAGGARHEIRAAWPLKDPA